MMQTCVLKTLRKVRGSTEGMCSSRRQENNVQLADQKIQMARWLRERTIVIASRSLQVKIEKMEVMEELESIPHKAVSFLVERDEEYQVWREQK